MLFKKADFQFKIFRANGDTESAMETEIVQDINSTYICNGNWLNEKDESGNKKNSIHFDVNHINTIFYIDLADLKTKLTNRIRAII
jgi:hypothetical protein